MATTSFASSTTQMDAGDRRGSPTDGACLVLRDVATDRAEVNLVSDVVEEFGKPAHVKAFGLQDVECNALGRLGADAGKATELVDQFLNNSVVHGYSSLGWGVTRGATCSSSMNVALRSSRTTDSP